MAGVVTESNVKNVMSTNVQLFEDRLILDNLLFFYDESNWPL